MARVVQRINLPAPAPFARGPRPKYTLLLDNLVLKSTATFTQDTHCRSIQTKQLSSTRKFKKKFTRVCIRLRATSSFRKDALCQRIAVSRLAIPQSIALH